MIIAIVGGRDRKLSEKEIIQALPCKVSEISCIVSGGAVGVDTFAANFARSKNIQLIVMRPNYKKYGRSAPLIRNNKIVSMASFVLAFPGVGPGTRHSISQAKKYNVPVIVCEKSLKNQPSLF